MTFYTACYRGTAVAATTRLGIARLPFFSHSYTGSEPSYGGRSMKSWQYTVSLILGVVSLVLSVSIVGISRSNMAMQDSIQLRQQRLNGSVLAPQAQQIANNVLQDMAATASKNEKMRTLLAKHGYNVPAAPPPAAIEKPADKTPATRTEEK